MSGAAGRVSGRRTATGAAALRRGAAERGPGQLVGQLQQRVRRARHDVAGDVDDLAAAAPGSLPELLERLPGLDPVPLGQYADRLLDPDPGGQRVLKLADCGAQPPSLAARAARCRGPAWPGGVAVMPFSAASRSARIIAQVRSGRSSLPTRQPSLVRRTTASSGTNAATAAPSAAARVDDCALDHAGGHRGAAELGAAHSSVADIGAADAAARPAAPADLARRPRLPVIAYRLARPGAASRLPSTGSSSRCHPGTRQSGRSGSRRSPT